MKKNESKSPTTNIKWSRLKAPKLSPVACEVAGLFVLQDFLPIVGHDSLSPFFCGIGAIASISLVSLFRAEGTLLNIRIILIFK